MDFKLLLNRIYEISRISKNRELTSEEKIERDELRKEYIRIFKSNFKAQLDNIEIVDEEQIN